MFSRLLGRTPAADTLTTGLPPNTSPRANPEPGYAAVARFSRLAADLTAAARSAHSAPPRWKEGRLFFFDSRRQAELELACPHTPPPSTAFGELSARIAAELPALFASVELRHVARAVPGLRESAAELAAACPVAGELAELLAIPDEEVVAVLDPATRTGFRLAATGVADIGQFHVLLANATAGVFPREPTVPVVVPMVAEARFQMFAPAALRPDGTLPSGFAGSDHWLWPNFPLSRVPLVNGERVVLLGPPAFRQVLGVVCRFPSVAAEVNLLEVLSPFRVAERLGKLVGRLVSPSVPHEGEPAFAKAA